VQDTTGPIITSVPENITIACGDTPPVPPAASLPATDNCDAGVMQAVLTLDQFVAGACVGSGTLTRQWTATDQCGNSTTATQIITITDTTPPVVVGVPADAIVQCNAVPAAPVLSAVDDCDAAPMVSLAEATVPASCAGSYTITRTWTAIDSCGNVSPGVSQTIAVTDATPPVISGAPLSLTAECDNVPAAAGVIATDACDPMPALSHSDTVTLGLCPNNYIITRVWTATDWCGNTSTVTQTITVQDTTPPVFGAACPLATVNVNCDAGMCVATAASVNLQPPQATDNCGTVLISGTRSDRLPLTADYPQGETTITWTAVDAAGFPGCGNSSTCEQVVNVSIYNEVIVDVELSPTVAASVTRCITFELFNCASGSPIIVSQPIAFIDGAATDVSVLAPCGEYTCITARDAKHTLRRTDNDDFGIDGGKYVANFTGPGSQGDDDRLVGGNLNDDEFIDILDFGAFAGQWGTSPGASSCGTLGFHADISGDGTVFLDDFTFIQINFLDERDANCCGFSGLAGDSGGTGPVQEISTAELWALGMGELTIADLNSDGMLNQLDVAAFLNGAIPDRLAMYEVEEGGTWFESANWTGAALPDDQTDVMLASVGAVVVDRVGAVADDITVLPGGTLVISGGTLAAGSITVLPGAALRIEGDMSVLEVSSLSINAGAQLQWIGGEIIVEGGAFTLETDDLVVNDGSLELRDHATVWSEGVVRIGSHGEVRGDGVLGGAVENTGTIRLAGAIDVIGDYRQKPTGSLYAVLVANGTDVLHVERSAMLAGTLHVQIADGISPALGERFDIVVAPIMAGRFDRVLLPELPAGLTLHVEYSEDRLTIVVAKDGDSGSGMSP
jgi:hypothetical protein